LNSYAIYSVGSGHYFWSAPFSIPVVPSVIITTTNETGSGTGTFFPNWTVMTNGSLIAAKVPSTATGDFSKELPGRNVLSLTTSNNLGLTQVAGTVGFTTSTNYVTCGNGSGSGSLLIYSLTNSALGYDVTNITVYGGWADNGRDQQAYTVYYSTVMAPTNFIQLTSVSHNPSIGGSIQSATRLTLSSSVGVLATNVAALKFSFATPSSENGYCGYAAITVFGTASVVAPPTLGVAVLAGQTGFAMSLDGLFPGQNYQLQSTTNLSAINWQTETNFIATQATVVLTNSIVNVPQKFYRLMVN
jgi:hypothetical protein